MLYIEEILIGFLLFEANTEDSIDKRLSAAVENGNLGTIDTDKTVVHAECI